MTGHNLFLQIELACGDIEVDLMVRWEDYAATAGGCEKTIVFGGKAKLSGLWVPDRAAAAYVDRHPDRLIGFLSIDPTQPGWRDEIVEGHHAAVDARGLHAKRPPLRLHLGVCDKARAARPAAYRKHFRRPGAARMHYPAPWQSTVHL